MEGGGVRGGREEGGHISGLGNQEDIVLFSAEGNLRAGCRASFGAGCVACEHLWSSRRSCPVGMSYGYEVQEQEIRPCQLTGGLYLDFLMNIINGGLSPVDIRS